MFNDKLFVDTHSVIHFISLFISQIKSSGLLPDKNRLESSAKNNENIFSYTFAKSLIYIKKQKWPNIEPYGTPHVISLYDEAHYYIQQIAFYQISNQLATLMPPLVSR